MTAISESADICSTSDEPPRGQEPWPAGRPATPGIRAAARGARWRAAHLAATLRSPMWNRLRAGMEEVIHRRVPVVTTRGDITGRSVTASYTGNADGMRYIQPFVQECIYDTPPERSVRHIDRQNLPAELTADSPDLALIAGTARSVRQFMGPGAVLMPFRIHQVVDTSAGWDAVQQRISRRERARHRNWTEQFDYACAPTRDSDAYFHFYDRMVRPSMERRYGDRDRSLGREQGYHSIFRHGILFLVRSRGVAVAGSTCEIVRRRRLINARLIGVLDGEEGLRRNGAQNAIYHFILQWACANDIDRVDFQGCEPFLRKGTFQYKKRFGTRAVLPPNKYHDVRLVLQARRDTNAVRDVLVANPIMLVDDDGRLGAGYFHDDDRPPRLDIPYQCEGFQYRRLIHLDRFLAGAQS
jgi:hypothetical protein